MKEHAKEFQMDTDKFDVVRLALKATVMARNNSYSLVSMRSSRGLKMRRNASMAESASPVSFEAPKSPGGEDYIPPSGDIELTGTGEPSAGCLFVLPCLSDSNVPHGPLFAPLSEDSPVEMTGQPNVWDDGPVSLQLQEPKSLRPRIDSLGITLEESDPRPVDTNEGFSGDLDYLEAAYIANDLVNTQNIIDGMLPSVINPRDLLRMVTSRAPSFSDFFTARPQSHRQTRVVT